MKPNRSLQLRVHVAMNGDSDKPKKITPPSACFAAGWCWSLTTKQMVFVTAPLRGLRKASACKHAGGINRGPTARPTQSKCKWCWSRPHCAAYASAIKQVVLVKAPLCGLRITRVCCDAKTHVHFSLHCKRAHVIAASVHAVPFIFTSLRHT